ncbi:MAG: hypothetical protein ACLTX3_07320 [Lachnospiraceae bacterium]
MEIQRLQNPMEVLVKKEVKVPENAEKKGTVAIRCGNKGRSIW